VTLLFRSACSRGRSVHWITLGRPRYQTLTIDRSLPPPCRNEERAALLAFELNTTELIVLWALHAYHYPIERLNIKGLHRDTCCVHGAVSDDQCTMPSCYNARYRYPIACTAGLRCVTTATPLTMFSSTVASRVTSWGMKLHLFFSVFLNDVEY
jgi:hypothetical protein